MIQNFTTDIMTIPPSYSMKSLHSHELYELIFMTQGACTVYINKSFYNLSSGSLIVIPANTPHKTTYLSGITHKRMIFYFNTKELDWLKQELNMEEDINFIHELVLQIPKKRISFLSEMFSKLKLEKNLNDKLSESMMRTYFHEIMLFLLRCQMYKENLIQKTDVANEELQLIIDYILSNYSSNISLASTAKYFSLSESSLSKKFKHFTGYRFREYLIDVRLQAARNLLNNTTMTISEISEKCGFTNSNAFGDTFKKIYGISPRNYRKSV